MLEYEEYRIMGKKQRKNNGQKNKVYRNEDQHSHPYPLYKLF